MGSQTLTPAPATERGHRRATWRARRLAVCDIEIAVFEAGRNDADAPVLLLVHGMGHWADAAWSYVAAEFEATHRIVAFDLPGFGASHKPAVAYTLPFFTNVVRAVARDAGAAPFALIGHSLGGLIAADYASRYPADVRQLTLIDPAGFLPAPPIVFRIVGSSLASKILGTIEPTRAFIERTVRIAVYDVASLSPEYLERAVALRLDPAIKAAFLRVLAGTMNELVRMKTLHARFAATNVPTLLIWGRQDRFVPIKALATARRIYPHAEVLVIDRCGHVPNVEYPAVVTQRMRASGA